MKNLKESIEKERLFCLDILNKQFVHEGNSGCLTDRQVLLVLYAMQEALLIDRHVHLVSNFTQEALQKKKFNLTQEEIENLAIVFAKTQVSRGANIPEWDDKAEEIIARYFKNGYNKALENNSERKYTAEDMNNFAEWYIRNTGRYDDDNAALREGLYLKEYESINKK